VRVFAGYCSYEYPHSFSSLIKESQFEPGASVKNPAFLFTDLNDLRFLSGISKKNQKVNDNPAHDQCSDKFIFLPKTRFEAFNIPLNQWQKTIKKFKFCAVKY